MPSAITPRTTSNLLRAGFLPTISEPDQSPSTVSTSSASTPMSTHQSTQNPSANPSTLSAVPTTQAPDITAMANAINALVQSNVSSRVKLREPDENPTCSMVPELPTQRNFAPSCFTANSTSEIAQIFFQMEPQRSITFFPI